MVPYRGKLLMEKTFLGLWLYSRKLFPRNLGASFSGNSKHFAEVFCTNSRKFSPVKVSRHSRSYWLEHVLHNQWLGLTLGLLLSVHWFLTDPVLYMHVQVWLQRKQSIIHTCSLFMCIGRTYLYHLYDCLFLLCRSLPSVHEAWYSLIPQHIRSKNPRPDTPMLVRH